MTTADLDVTFHVENKAKKGMVFDHLVASVTQRYKLEYYHAKAGTPLDPFELGGSLKSFEETVLFRLKGVTLDIGFHAWDVNFALTAHVTYRGRAWSKQRFPIHVLCDPVKKPFSSNATETKTVHFSL